MKPTTVRRITSIAVANASWVGLLLLVSSAALPLAVVAWGDLGAPLLGMAGLTCAPCVDPSTGRSTAAAAAGVAAAGAAAAGAAAGGTAPGAGDAQDETGETGGVNVGRDDLTSRPREREGRAGTAGWDAWSPPARAGRLQNVSNWAEAMTEAIMGKDPTTARPMTRN